MEPGPHVRAALRNPCREFSAEEQRQLVDEQDQALAEADRYLQRVREQMDILERRTAHLDGELRKVKWIFGIGALLGVALFARLIFTLVTR